MSLSGSQSQSGRGGANKKKSYPCPCRESKPGRASRSLVTMPTNVPRILMNIKDLEVMGMA